MISMAVAVTALTPHTLCEKVERDSGVTLPYIYYPDCWNVRVMHRYNGRCWLLGNSAFLPSPCALCPVSCVHVRFLTSLEEKKKGEKKKKERRRGKLVVPPFPREQPLSKPSSPPYSNLLYILFFLLSDSAYISTEYRHIEKYRGEAKKKLVYIYI